MTTSDDRSKHREINRRWRQRNPDYFKVWRAKLTPEQDEALRDKKAGAHQERRQAALKADPEGYRAQRAAASREWSRAHPERARDLHKAYYAKNREQILERERERYRSDPDRGRDKWLRSHYGITLDDWRVLMAVQNERCAICQQPESITLNGKVKRLHVDHDHVSGRVRGLLCFRCNAMLGHVAENTDVFQRAIEYLRSA